jgi:hypothetical protein
MAAHVPPLTARGKFKVVARSSFDYVQVPWYGFLAGVSQAENSEPGYGQGAEGYGKRFGAAYADGTIENFMTGAVLPSLLHQDPRFFQSSEGGFARRTGYAVSRILSPVPIPGTRSSTFLRSSGVRFPQVFPLIATIPERIKHWRILPASGDRKWATTPSRSS